MKGCLNYLAFRWTIFWSIICVVFTGLYVSSHFDPNSGGGVVAPLITGGMAVIGIIVVALTSRP